MAPHNFKGLTPDRAVELVRNHGGLRAAVRATGIPYSNLHYAYAKAVAAESAPALEPRAVMGGPLREDKLAATIGKPRVDGQVLGRTREALPLPKRGKIARYLLTCAQNNTHLHEPFWRNLNALAGHYAARIMVSRFTYDRANYATTKPGARLEYEDLWYAPEIVKHISDEPVLLAPGLAWCGEMNIIPTAVRPLSGLEVYTSRLSGIFPHVKLAMQSVPSGKYEPTKFNYTTGTVTLRNYVQRKAGIKAEQHHVYGALLVEVDDAGHWWVRQVSATEDGDIQDLDVVVRRGRVTTGNRVEGITWGDIHAVQLDPEVERLAWAPGGMLDTLRPRFQFMHDLLDFRSRNHHDIGNPHAMYQRFVDGEDSVAAEVDLTARFVAKASRAWCETVVVKSNHDSALERWLREADYRRDPANAPFFLEAQLEVYRAIGRRERGFDVIEWAMRRAGDRTSRYLREDESFVICKGDAGIECGNHGHLGPNGARGSALAFARSGRRCNVGHTHSAGILDGVYTAGVSGRLDMDYNRGPSSWSASHTVTYPGGQRAICTMYAGRWRA